MPTRASKCLRVQRQPRNSRGELLNNRRYTRNNNTEFCARFGRWEDGYIITTNDNQVLGTSYVCGSINYCGVQASVLPKAVLEATRQETKCF